MTIKLNKEGKEILDSYENDEWASVSTELDIAKYKAAARKSSYRRPPLTKH